MPKFMKDKAVELIDSGLETYFLALYGLTIPNIRSRKRQESKYAPVMGLFGATTELLIKACLVQEKGISAMYKDGNTATGIYKVGSEVLKEFRTDISQANQAVSFIWKDSEDIKDQQNKLLFYLKKFQLLQDLRAQGLHAGIGCSRDVAVVTANDVYEFITLLSQGKRLKAYIKNIPAPEATIKDREIIIEDLSRRLNTKKLPEDKIGFLRNMYLVMPYVPDIAPEWIEAFEKVAVTPPTVDDVNYLAKTLSEAHSIYLLKSRGGKEGIPVKIEQNNPNAVPVDVQYLKRTLSTIPDQFNNDILSANTRLNQDRLDLPIDDFLIDLFTLGLENANVMVDNVPLTAQQAWPFVVSAYSVAGTPRPCMEFIKYCDEPDQLIAFLKKAKTIGNGYYKRRVDTIIQCISCIKQNKPVDFTNAKDPIFKEISQFTNKYNEKKTENPFTPQYIRKFPVSEDVSAILQDYICGNISAGDSIKGILNKKQLEPNERKAVLTLLRECSNIKDKNGIVALMRHDEMKGYYSLARKIIFFIDFLYNYPGRLS